MKSTYCIFVSQLLLVQHCTLYVLSAVHLHVLVFVIYKSFYRYNDLQLKCENLSEEKIQLYQSNQDTIQQKNMELKSCRNQLDQCHARYTLYACFLSIKNVVNFSKIA